MTPAPLSRRHALGALGGAVAAATLGASPALHAAPPAPGRLRQSVARWCFARTPIDDLCALAASVGLMGIDLLGPDEWAAPARHGLRCTMANSFHTIPLGFNRPDQHDRLVAEGSAYIPKVAAAGIERVVVFSGNRAGMSDGEGIANCIAGLRRLMPVAERHGVTLCLEMLNSRVDHADYHADTTAFGVAVARGVDSPRMRLLYDVYHMLVMEGNVIATIRAALPWIAHVHTAGVPGRHELDASQELQYPAIARALADAGYAGVVAHEFLPVGDAAASLRQAVEACRA